MVLKNDYSSRFISSLEAEGNKKKPFKAADRKALGFGDLKKELSGISERIE